MRYSPVPEFVHSEIVTKIEHTPVLGLSLPHPGLYRTLLRLHLQVNMKQRNINYILINAKTCLQI